MSLEDKLDRLIERYAELGEAMARQADMAADEYVRMGCSMKSPSSANSKMLGRASRASSRPCTVSASM